MTEQLGVIETFFDIDDAYMFMESKIREEAVSGWDLFSGGMTYVNFQWRVGLEFERKNG